MYEKLIKKLRYCGNAISCIHCPHWEGCAGPKEDLSEAANAIEELSRDLDSMNDANIALYGALPKWIPVTERLPEKDIEVLVFAEGKIEGFFGDTVIAISKRYDFKIFTDSEGVEMWQSPWQYFLTDYEITHWMPLPEQPTQKEET